MSTDISMSNWSWCKVNQNTSLLHYQGQPSEVNNKMAQAFNSQSLNALDLASSAQQSGGAKNGISAIDSQSDLARMGQTKSPSSLDAIYSSPSPFIQQKSSDPTRCHPDRPSMGIIEKLGFRDPQKRLLKVDNIVVEVTYYRRTGNRCVAHITQGPSELLGFKTTPLHRNHGGNWEKSARQQIAEHVRNKAASPVNPSLTLNISYTDYMNGLKRNSNTGITTPQSAQNPAGKHDVDVEDKGCSERRSSAPTNEEKSFISVEEPTSLEQVPYQDDMVLTTPHTSTSDETPSFLHKIENFSPDKFKEITDSTAIQTLVNKTLEQLEGLSDTLHEELLENKLTKDKNLQRSLSRMERSLMLEKHEIACATLERDQAKAVYETMNRDPKVDLNVLKAQQQQLEKCQQKFNESLKRLKQLQQNYETILQEIQEWKQNSMQEPSNEDLSEKKSSWVSEKVAAAKKACDDYALQGKNRSQEGKSKQEQARVLLEKSQEQELLARQILVSETTETNIAAFIQADQAARQYRQQSQTLHRKGTADRIVGKAQKSASKEAKKQVEGFGEAAGSSLGSELVYAMMDRESGAGEKCVRVAWNTGKSVGSQGVKSVLWEGAKGGVSGYAPSVAKKIPGLGSASQIYSIARSAWSSKSWTEAGTNAIQAGLQVGGQQLTGYAGQALGTALGTALVPFVGPAGPYIGATAGGMVGTGAYELGAFLTKKAYAAL